MDNTHDPATETWGVVEVMGHTRYAGRISQHAALGTALIRVEVPAIEGIPAFEKLLAPSSLFAITPCTQALAIEAAKRFRSRPFTLLDLPELARRPALRHEPEEDDDWDA